MEWIVLGGDRCEGAITVQLPVTRRPCARKEEVYPNLERFPERKDFQKE